MNDWTYDPSDDTWKWGTTTFGCGVYKLNNKWEGNVVIDTNIYGVTRSNTKEEAMEKAINKFNVLYKDYLKYN